MLIQMIQMMMIVRGQGDEVAADIYDAVDHNQQLEDMRSQAMALQAEIHLNSVASQGLQLAHVRAERQK